MLANTLVPTVPVMLDRERHLRLDFNALAIIEEVLGETALDGSVFKRENLTKARYLRAILYGCLKHEDESLTLERVGSMLALSNIEVVSKALTEVFNGAFGESSGNAKRATSEQ